MKWLYFERAGVGKKEETKNKYKTQDPRGLFPIMHCSLLPTHCRTHRLGLRFTSHKPSVSREHAEMGVNNGYPRVRRLIGDNNTPTLISTRTRETLAKSVCMIACAGMFVHTWMWLTMPAWGFAYPHICIIPVCFSLGQRIGVKLQRVCICSHVDGGWVLDLQLWLAMHSVAPKHRWTWRFCTLRAQRTTKTDVKDARPTLASSF